MSDRAALDQLFANYAWAMDSKEFEVFDEVFSTGASFVVSIAGTVAAGPFEGRDATVDFIRTTTEGQGDQRRHVITNVRQVGSDKATATLTLIVVDNDELTVKSCGVYRCDLVEENGALRFGAMDLALDLGF
jgi:hypothetical protein